MYCTTCEAKLQNLVVLSNVKNVISFRGLLVFFFFGVLGRLMVNSCLLWHKGSRCTILYILFWQNYFQWNSQNPFAVDLISIEKNLQILNEQLSVKLLMLSQYWDKFYYFHSLLSLSCIQLITFFVSFIFHFSNDFLLLI